MPAGKDCCYSLIGTAVGLVLLLPAYAIGGMGAGDVKLLAGVGAWVWGTVTLYAFAVSAHGRRRARRRDGAGGQGLAANTKTNSG